MRLIANTLFRSKLTLALVSLLLVSGASTVSAQTSYIILKGKGGVAQLKATPESAASTNASVPVGLVVKGTGGSKVDESGKRWLKVKYGGNSGWVEASSTFKVKGSGQSQADTTQDAPAPKLQANEITVITPKAATTSNTSNVTVSVKSSASTASNENVFALPAKTTGSVFSGSNKSEIESSLRAKENKIAKRKAAERKKRDNLLTNQVRKPTNGVTYTVVDAVLYARAEPNPSYTPIMSLGQNQQVKWTGLEARFPDGTVWWQVDSFGAVGWVPRSGLSGQQVQVITPLQPIVTPSYQPVQQQVSVPQQYGYTSFAGQRWAVVGISGGLRLRNGPGTSYQAIASIPSNYTSLVALGETQNGWLRVRYGNSAGWVSMDYVTPR